MVKKTIPSMESDSFELSNHRNDKNEWITLQSEISMLEKQLETQKGELVFVITYYRERKRVELVEEIAREMQESQNLGAVRR